MRTSFHHQPEAQHPKSPAIETPAGRLPHLRVISGQIIAGSNPNLSAVTPIADIRRCIGPTGSKDRTERTIGRRWYDLPRRSYCLPRRQENDRRLWAV
jgi:hypothetical protein